MIALHCPHCGHEHDLLAALDAGDGHAFFERLTALPAPAIKPVLRYLMLFAPARRRLSWARLGRLLAPLADAIGRGDFTRDGKRYSAPLDAWVRAMTALVDAPPATLRLPLKSHGYLLEMLAAPAARARPAEVATAPAPLPPPRDENPGAHRQRPPGPADGSVAPVGGVLAQVRDRIARGGAA